MFKPLSEAKLIRRIKFFEKHKLKIGIPMVAISLLVFGLIVRFDDRLSQMIVSLPYESETSYTTLERQAMYLSGYKVGLQFGIGMCSAGGLFLAGMACILGERKTKMLVKYYEQTHRTGE